MNIGQIKIRSQRVIEQFGALITIIRKIRALGDPDKPWRSDGSGELSENVRAVIVSPQRQRIGTNVDEQFDDETLVGERILYIAEASLTEKEILKLDSLIRINNEDWQVVSISRVEPSGDTILFKVQVRR